MFVRDDVKLVENAKFATLRGNEFISKFLKCESREQAGPTHEYRGVRNWEMNEMEYLRLSFLRMAIEGNFTCTEDELQSWAGDIGIKEPMKGWTCVVIHQTEKQTSDPKAAMHLQMLEGCRRFLRNSNVPANVLFGSNMDILILAEGEQENVCNQIRKLLLYLQKRYKASVQIGVGRMYSRLSLVQYSRAEAYVALRYADSDNQMVDICDVYRMHGLSAVNTRNGRSPIVDRFMEGKLENLREELVQLAEITRSNTVIFPEIPYPTSIRRTMIEILLEIMHAASDAGIDVDKEIGYVDPYRKVFELVGTPAIIEWVVEIAQKLSKAMFNRQTLVKNDLFEEAKKYILTHLSNPDLCLAEVSLVAGMSSGYFSAQFSKVTGTGFREYITNQRVRRAKQLLEQSQKSIESIAEECGFLSASYFITVFKKQMGMTPGIFRKLQSGNDHA